MTDTETIDLDNGYELVIEGKRNLKTSHPGTKILELVARMSANHENDYRLYVRPRAMEPGPTFSDKLEENITDLAALSHHLALVGEDFAARIVGDCVYELIGLIEQGPGTSWGDILTGEDLEPWEDIIWEDEP